MNVDVDREGSFEVLICNIAYIIKMILIKELLNTYSKYEQNNLIADVPVDRMQQPFQYRCAPRQNIYHTSKAINFNMTNATKKDWKGWELGYGGGGYEVATYNTASGSAWRVPDKWDPNYTIFFQWAGNNEIYTKPKRAFVKLPKYKDEEKIYLAIHFFPNDNIKVFVTNMTPNYSDYPYG